MSASEFWFEPGMFIIFPAMLSLFITTGIVTVIVMEIRSKYGYGYQGRHRGVYRPPFQPIISDQREIVLPLLVWADGIDDAYPDSITVRTWLPGDA